MITRNHTLPRDAKLLSDNRLVAIFVSTHLLFAIFLGKLFALAPDEASYLYTFNNLYGSKDANPQFSSGWITAPKPFLWVIYLPARFLTTVGVPDYLSIRILSIAIATISLVLLRNLTKRSNVGTGLGDSMLFVFFFIPSIFLWTSIGLREVFILAEISLIFVGLDYLFRGNNGRGLAYLFLGSYALLSTKNYLWICLVISVLILTLIFALNRVARRKLVNLSVGLVLLPCVAFASTTSISAFQFLVSSVFHANLSGEAYRSGDSTIQIALTDKTPPDSSSPGKTGSSGGTGNPTENPTNFVTFHGDTTLILLHYYLVDHPNSLFTRTLRALGITKKIQAIWLEKTRSGQVKKTSTALPDSSSLSGYILKAGQLHDPLSVVRPAFLFMFGPIPLLDHGGLALNLVALESPMWWLLYAMVVYRLIRYRKVGYLRDPVFLLATTYFLSLVAVSALVEVNLGTSFRHRSILLIPLIVMYIRARSGIRTRAIAH